MILAFSCKEEKQLEVNPINDYQDYVDKNKFVSETEVYAHVDTENGLNVRGVSGEVIGKLENASKVRIKSYSEDVMQVSDNGKTLSGRTVEIDFYQPNNSEPVKAFVFEGYLKTLSEIKLYQSEVCFYQQHDEESYFTTEKPICDNPKLKLELITKETYSKLQFISSPQITNTDLVVKVNDSINLPIANGFKTIMSSPIDDESDNRAIYDYLGEMEVLNSYLLDAVYYESGDYRLYSKITGEEIANFKSLPIVSPNKNFIISIGFNGYEDVTELEIATIDNQIITSKELFLYQNWGRTNDSKIKWLTDSVFVVEVIHTNILFDMQENELDVKQYLKVSIL
jgi:hypothetical protein